MSVPQEVVRWIPERFAIDRDPHPLKIDDWPCFVVPICVLKQSDCSLSWHSVSPRSRHGYNESVHLSRCVSTYVPFNNLDILTFRFPFAFNILWQFAVEPLPGRFLVILLLPLTLCSVIPVMISLDFLRLEALV
jgi:hypothetical protein